MRRRARYSVAVPRARCHHGAMQTVATVLWRRLDGPGRDLLIRGGARRDGEHRHDGERDGGELHFTTV